MRGANELQELSGKISDRVRITDPNNPKYIPSSAFTKGRDLGEAPPSGRAVRDAEGHGLGRGATRERNGGAS